jgi:hypothetical protein
MFSVKAQVESGYLTSVPPNYVFDNSNEYISSEAEMIPTIDVSLLTSGTPDQRSKVIQDIGNACRDWGFFQVISWKFYIFSLHDCIHSQGVYYDLTLSCIQGNKSWCSRDAKR